MKRGAPWEVWAGILMIAAVAALPIILGILAFKIYRKYKPIEVPEVTGLAALEYAEGDSFFKKYLVGWLISAPILYLMYFLLNDV